LLVGRSFEHTFRQAPRLDWVAIEALGLPWRDLQQRVDFAGFGSGSGVPLAIGSDGTGGF
jgi:hypothetical protein